MLAVINRLYICLPHACLLHRLREHLHNAGIDAVYVHLSLEQYLNFTDYLLKSDWFTDPQDDHQAWHYRDTISQFIAMIVDKPDEGNGYEVD